MPLFSHTQNVCFLMTWLICSFQVTFESVGGLGKHIRALKEMVVFPLLYPEIFERFKINPPRGVLFYGPPGIMLSRDASKRVFEVSDQV